MATDISACAFPGIRIVLYDDNYLPDNWSIWLWVVSFVDPSRAVLHAVYFGFAEVIRCNRDLFFSASSRCFDNLGLCLLCQENEKIGFKKYEHTSEMN